MIYDILPTQNLKYDDVRDTLASSGGSVNNNMSSLFQSTSGINKWSKYKPVRFKDKFPELNSYWYTADDGNCGFGNSINDYDSKGLIEAYINGNTWTYQNPRGGENEPYRLGDFRGYYAKAKAFLFSGIKKGFSKTIFIGTGGSGNIQFTFETYSDDRCIGIEDFNRTAIGDLVNAKLVALVYSGNPISYPSLTATDVFIGDYIKNTNPSITINFSGQVESTKYIIFALTFDNAYQSYMTLPYIDENNWYMAEVKLTTNPNIGAYLYLSKIGFQGLFVNTPLTDIRDFMTSDNPLKLEERGIFRATGYYRFEGATQDVIIYTNDQYSFVLYNNGIEYTIPNVRITKINGVSPTYPFTILKTDTDNTIEWESNNDSDIIYPYEKFTDGLTEVRIYKKGYEDAKLTGDIIYVDFN